jgi:hypothetical protein
MPKTTSGNIDGEAHRGWAERRAGQAVGQADRAVNPSSETDAFGVRCNSERDPPQMALAEDDDVIEAFPADRADQSLRMPALPGRPRRRRVIAYAHGHKTLCDRLAVASVTVPDHV